MISFTARSDGAPEIKLSLNGVPVFLDQFAIKKLAKEDASRRLRFTEAMRKGGDLIFSVSNAAELTGPTGKSAEKIRKFLTGLGAHWFPVEMDAKLMSDREVSMLRAGNLTGTARADNIACKQLAKDFFDDRLVTQPRGELVDLSPDTFFDLGWFIEKLSRQRDSIITGKRQMGEVLRERIIAHRKKLDHDPNWIDSAFPIIPFDSRFPITFAYAHLIRILIAEAKSHQITENDGIDFSQAVIAASAAKLATLDKHWNRRVAKIPQPHGLAQVYDETRLDQGGPGLAEVARPGILVLHLSIGSRGEVAPRTCFSKSSTNPPSSVLQRSVTPGPDPAWRWLP